MRFLLATAWLTSFLNGYQDRAILAPIAVAAAGSDFLDGYIARRMGHSDGFGQWLDSLADIAFIATALICESIAGSIPAYIPLLVVASFAQYAVDSILISRSPVPVRSRIGHLGGIVNYSLVLVLAFAPPPQWPGVLVRDLSPLLAIFYLLAIVERVLNYKSSFFSAYLNRALKPLGGTNTVEIGAGHASYLLPPRIPESR